MKWFYPINSDIETEEKEFASKLAAHITCHV